MDALFYKYARPFDFVDGMISTLRLCEFVDGFLEAENDRKMWEFYLHKVYDKSFEDFKNSVRVTAQERPSAKQIETTLTESKNILNGFTPN